MATRRRSRASRHRTTPDPRARAIGARVRRFRGEQQFSFDAFVEETGLGRGYVSELERGLVVPTVGTLAKVADALELTLADLVLGNSPRERLFAELRGATEDEVLRARVAALRALGRSGPAQTRTAGPEPVLRTADSAPPASRGARLPRHRRKK